MSEQRRRGRPRGTGKNDAPHLERVAELIVLNPNLKPTTATKQLIAERADWPETAVTLLRRWQVKWQAGRARYMEAARIKAMPKPSASSGGGGYIPLTAYERFSRHEQLMRDAIDSPHMRAFREATSMVESPIQKMMREEQRMRDLIDPPHMRALRQALDSSMQREMRRMEEMQRLMRGAGLW